MTRNRGYRIPAENLADLTVKFEKLAKRADKLGVPAPGFTKIAVEETDHHGILDTYYWVTVTGDAPKFAGWELTAVIALDHAEPDAPNVVTVVGDADLDEVLAWRGLGDICHHCNVDNRGRNKLVVVTHDNGDRKVVGTTCLRDFLGHTSPEAIATWAQWIEEATDLSEYEAHGTRTEYRFDPVTYVAWVARAITEGGWTPRSRASAEKDATADTAYHLFLLDAGLRKLTKWETRPDPLTDDETALAAAALDWAKTVDTGNDYLANLQAVASKTTLRSSDIGLAASALPAYQREQGKLIERAAAAAATAGSVHFGAVKERLTLTATVVFTKVFDGFYGPTALVKLLTEDGNVAVWWCSNTAKAPAQGAVVTGKATVKAHETYEGVAQTVLTRAALTIVEDAIPEAADEPAPEAPAAPALTSHDLALIDPDAPPIAAPAALPTADDIVTGAAAQYPDETFKAPQPVLAITGRHTGTVKAWWAVDTVDGLFVATDDPAAMVRVDGKRTYDTVRLLPEFAPLIAHTEQLGIPVETRI